MSVRKGYIMIHSTSYKDGYCQVVCNSQYAVGDYVILKKGNKKQCKVIAVKWNEYERLFTYLLEETDGTRTWNTETNISDVSDKKHMNFSFDINSELSKNIISDGTLCYSINSAEGYNMFSTEEEPVTFINSFTEFTKR